MLLASSLTTLETSGLIALAQVEPELEYLFRHALIQDAAYESMLKADRKRLHLIIGEALERLYPERLDELASTLGQHFAAAGEMERARKYFTLAGDFARKQYANAEAKQNYCAALELSPIASDREQALSGLGEALVGQSRFAEAFAVWHEAMLALGLCPNLARVGRSASHPP
jgi:predicted ATPase